MKKTLAIVMLLLMVICHLLISSQAQTSNNKSASYTLAAINPTAESNPLGAFFPGFRGGNQLIKYTSNFGKYTGTNEYGTEITVVNNRVSEKNGSDSLIPSNGYVLSGHGAAKTWLNSNTIIGAYITIDKNNKVLAVIKPDSYVFSANKMISEAKRFMDTAKYNKNKTSLIEAKGYLNKALSNYSKARKNINKNNDETIKFAKLAYNNAEIAFYKALPSRFNEERGIWCRPIEKNEDEITKTIDKIAKAKFKTIYLETFYHGYTIYPSDVAHSYGITNQNPKYFGSDPLRTWIKIAHSKGLKVYPWIETFYVGTGNKGPILSIKPEWGNIQKINIDSDSLKASTTEPGAYFIDPANQQAREYITRIITEIVTEYDVDGINLDYIRYPNSLPVYFPNYLSSTWGYTEVARKEFEDKYNVDPGKLTSADPDWQNWEEYRQEKINITVNKIYKSIKSIKPDVQLSAVIFPDLEEAQTQKLQGWKTWVDNGYIDILTPIILGSSPELINSLSTDLMKLSCSKVKIYIGVFGAFNNDLPVIFAKQVYSAQKAGVDGINIFDAAHLSDNYINALIQGPFKSP